MTKTTIADSSEAGTGGNLAALAEELREYTAMKYMGNCKCGKCQLVPREFIDRLYVALSAPVGEPVAYRYRYNGQWYLSQSKSFALNGFDLQPLYTHPPAPAVGAEDVARLIDPMAFKSWHGLYDYCIRDGADDAFARRCADSTHKADCDAALAKADAILSLLSGQGAQNNSINPINHEQSK